MKKTAAALLLVTLALVLPLALVWSAWRSYDTQLNQRRVYLRSRLAAVAALLETLPAAAAVESLYDEEPGLLELQIYRQPVPGDGLDSLWQGRELFRLEDTTSRAQPALRGYLPFHSDGALRLARIDIAFSSAELLVQPARRSLAVSALAGVAILLLSLLSAWAFERSRRAELRQAELEHLAQIGQLSAVLAHEIRNPLGTIKGFAQLLGEQVPPALSAFVDPILTQTARLEQLVRDLLLYGRPPQPAPSSVPISEIVARLRDHAAHLDAPGVDIRFRAPTGGSIYVDAGILDQALLNLLRNAVEAVGDQPGAVVSVGISPTPEGIHITVEDNGPGFTPEAQAALFQPFFTTKAFGTGLGLSTTRNLIRSLGGSLSIRAKSGAGALVEVQLPRQTP